jgi:hypothetical protein
LTEYYHWYSKQENDKKQVKQQRTRHNVIITSQQKCARNQVNQPRDKGALRTVADVHIDNVGRPNKPEFLQIMIVRVTVAQLLLSIILAQLPIHKMLAVLQHHPDAGVHSKVDVDPVVHFVCQDAVDISR